MFSGGRLARGWNCRRWLAMAISAAAACALGACSMASSTSLLEGDAGSDCSGSAGGYYLSKSHLHVVVTRENGGKPQLDNISVVAHADRTSGYCLNFLGSKTSKDTFIVEKDPTEHLLTRITSRGEDRSKEIADTIVQTVFRGIEAAAAGPFRAGTEAPPRLANAFEGEYDPFNEYEARLLNDGLKDMGFCLYLDDGVRNRKTAMQAYCDNPLGDLGREQVFQKANAYASRKPRADDGFRRADGVLYRPRLPYTLYLFQNRRADLKLPGTWALWQSGTVYLENKAPTLAVAIDRTYFATRKTTLRFNMGALQEVYIDKDSELANAATIPLKIANSIVELPSKIVQVRLDQTFQREQLIKAQDQLIKAERALADARAGFKSEVAAAATAKAPSSGATDARSADRAPDQCKRDMAACTAGGATTVSACAVELGCPEQQ
jgi:hypothetical protein